MSDYLHNHKSFAALLRIVGKKLSIDPGLIEKDYWIMHTLFGLKQQEYKFELKGGTSLSKAFGIIHRFSEDIDIHIKPPATMEIAENPKKIKKTHIASRRDYYDWLTADINIDGITAAARDTEFDDKQYYRGGGIRLYYKSHTDIVDGIKEGILLEVGFDTVTPNKNVIISSWAYDEAINNNVDIIDNRAIDIACYHPGYTLVEKLQTITTKFRQEQEDDEKVERQNLMRQYYDVFSLLGNTEVQQFIGTEEYFAHKNVRFSPKDKEIEIVDNQAFLLHDDILRKRFEERYKKTAALYYNGQPPFNDLLVEIAKWLPKL